MWHHQDAWVSSRQHFHCFCGKGLPMGTNRALHLAHIFLYSYKAELYSLYSLVEINSKHLCQPTICPSFGIRPFLKHYTLTHKAVGNLWRDLICANLFRCEKVLIIVISDYFSGLLSSLQRRTTSLLVRMSLDIFEILLVFYYLSLFLDLITSIWGGQLLWS